MQCPYIIYDLDQLFHFDILFLECHISVNSAIYLLSKWFCIGFVNQNRNQNISGTAYRSDLCLYGKRTGGHNFNAHIKHITVALILTEI